MADHINHNTHTNKHKADERFKQTRPIKSMFSRRKERTEDINLPSQRRREIEALEKKKVGSALRGAAFNLGKFIGSGVKAIKKRR